MANLNLLNHTFKVIDLVEVKIALFLLFDLFAL